MNLTDIKVRDTKLDELEIHELANSLPKMTYEQYKSFKMDVEKKGQLEAVLVYRGKIIDGRHRYFVLQELGATTIKTKTLQSNLSLDEVRDIVFSMEARRHKSATQVAIYAWKTYHIEKQQVDNKVSQTDIAERFGTSRRNIGRVEKLNKLVGINTINHLYDGGSVNVGDEYRKIHSTSLDTIIKYYEKVEERDFASEDGSKINKDLLDEESFEIDADIEILLAKHTSFTLSVLAKRLYAKVKELEKDSNTQMFDDMKESDLKPIDENVLLDT